MKKNKKGFSLPQMEKKDFFEEPKNYFIDFPGKLAKKVKTRENKVVRADWRYMAGGVAAALAFLLALALNELNDTKETPLRPEYARLLDETPTSEIVAYLLHSDIGAEELIAELAASKKNFYPKSVEVPDLELQKAETDALLDYYNIK